MTDVFGMFPHYDANNNTATNNQTDNYSSNGQNVATDKAMLELNNYSSIDFNDPYGFGDSSTNYYQNVNNNQYRMQTEEQSPHKPEIIHSGHFMVSEIDKDDDVDNETNVDEETVLQKEDKNESTEDEQITTRETPYSTTTFANSDSNRSNKKNWNIEYPKLPSLDALFKKMNLGNEGKFTSPKWKQFTGMKIGLKAKIRVNNLIWRVWHIKYVQGKIPKWNPFPPQFNTDSLDNNHVYVAHRPEVMKMGKFFKISQVNHDFIALEYGKWRRYYKEIIHKKRNKQIISTNLVFSNYEVFNNSQFDSSNDQFNFTAMFPPISNYSSSQLGMQAEFMQPDFPYNMQPELMDTFEEPCLQKPFQESQKIQDVVPIYTTTDNTMSTNMNANYEPQANNQLNNNNQMNTMQQQPSTQQQIQATSTVNYNNFMNYQPQQQPQQTNLMQNQQNRLTSISYGQNYLPIVDQQNRQNGQGNQQSTGLSTIVQNQSRNVLIPMDQNQNSNNNGQFMIPKPVKPKIRSRSVSSLPQQQQVQLQRQHMMENASSLMEINQPMLNNQSTNFHNTTSNLASTQGDLQRQQNRANRANQSHNSISNMKQMIPERVNNYTQRSSALVGQGSMINQQVIQTASNSNYYNMNLNSQNTQASNTPLSNEYTNNRGLCNQSTSSTSYYSNQLQLNPNQQQPQQSISVNSNPINTSIQNQNLNTILNNSNSRNYNSNSNTILITQLLSTNSNKSVAGNLQSQQQQATSNSTSQFKRNSTGTYPSFNPSINQQQYASDQFTANDGLANSSSINNLTMSNTSANSNGINSPMQNTSEQYPNRTNQLARKSSNHSSPNQLFLSNCISNTVNNNSSLINTSSVLQPLIMSNNDHLTLHHSNHNSSNSTSSQESLSKNLSTKSHRIKRESHNRKLSTGKLRTSSTNLSRSNSAKSTNALSPISPTPPPLQSTLLNQVTTSKQQINTPVNEFLNFDHNSNLMITNSTVNLKSNSNSNLPTNLNTNSPSLSSTSTIQSPIANSPFASSQNDYSNDSIAVYNHTSSSLYQNRDSSPSSQQLRKFESIEFVSQSSNSNIVPNLSSLNSNLIKNERDPNRYREHRRVCHINAEQKRRCNIKHGFDTLRAILPSISSNNTKISKAAMLQKGAEHIRHLRIEQDAQKQEIETFTVAQTMKYHEFYQHFASFSSHKRDDTLIELQ